ncbi:hypothetical protein N7507_007858 [Penicillium longicatenatum]|nr:hypothetical protein N7507_007858 [Penicillium longicatenatum]
MSSSSDNIGYSIRNNGSCASTEVECGQTWSPFHACCPSGTYCPSGQSNVICCDSDADCLDYFKDDPHCANSTANMYKANGYFCCAAGLSAFELENGFVGCTDDISVLGTGTKLLTITSSGSTSSTATPTTSSSSTTTPASAAASTTEATTSTSASTSPASTASDAVSNKASSSSTNTGAIAGGVVGGVAAVAIIAGLLWFFLRRRNQEKQPPELGDSTASGQVQTSTTGPYNARVQVRGPPMTELDSNKGAGAVELPGHVQYG